MVLVAKALRPLVPAIVSLLVAPALGAQAVVPSPVPYEIETWTIADGIPANEVTALQQTRDGRLWIGTYGGLARFDGVAFEVIDLDTHPGLRSNRVISLLESRDGALWIGTENYALIRYADEQFTHFSAPEDVPHHRVFCLHQDLHGRIWVGTEGGLSWIDGDRVHRVPEVEAEVWCLTDAPDGTLWIGSSDGLVMRSAETFEVVDERHITCLLTTSEGEVWAGIEDSSVLRYRRGAMTELPLPGEGPVRTLVEDSDGGVWLGMRRRPWRWIDGTLEDPLSFELGGRIPALASQTALLDSEGSLWFGGSDGLHRVRATPFSTMAVVPNANARAVAADRKGRLWVAMQNNQLVCIDGEETRRFDAPGAPSASSLAVAGDGTVWTSSPAGIWHLRDDDIVRVDVGELPRGTRWALLQDQRNRLWISCGDHLIRRLGNDRTFTPDDLTGGVITALYETSEGDVWVGTDRGLSRIRGDRVVRSFYRDEELPPGTVRALFEDRERNLWVGTYGGGICRITPGGEIAFAGRQNGLYEGVVSRISSFDDSLLLQGNRAISLVSLKDLTAIAEGRLERTFPQVFATGPGLEIFEGMGGATPLSCRDRDGVFWFPAMGGLARFDPSALVPIGAPPQVWIESLTIDGQDYPLEGVITTERVSGNLEFRFSAPAFVAPESNRFLYRLVGHHDHWLPAGPSRAAMYASVPPGDYTFQVRAVNRDGIGDASGASIDLWLGHAFYETALFRALCALLVVAAGCGTVLLWARSSRRRAKVLEDLVEARTRALELQQQLNHSQKFEALGRLAGGMAHDFNNILTAILAQSDIVLDSLDDRKATAGDRDGLHVIRDAGERAARLTRQLLAYSRKQILKPRVLPPNQTLIDLEPMLRSLVREDIDLVFDLASDLPAIRIDPDQMSQVIVNLVVNASDATPSGGKITLATSLDPEKPSRVVVEISDTGSGIAPEAMEHIFEPFFTTKPRGKGTGLGLASAHGIIRQSGGTIVARSEQGVGTTFTVRLPAVDATVDRAVEAPVRETVSTTDREAPRGDATVLICDDEPAILRAASQVLQNSGYSVLVASTPSQALELIRDFDDPIDLLITDVIMPGMSGADLAAEVQSSHPRIRVLYITGYSPDVLDTDGGIGPDLEFLHKPFNSDALLHRVAELLVRSA